MNDPRKAIVPGSIYEMFMDGTISTRLHNGLVCAYSNKFNMFYVNSKDLSLEEILSGLNISEPKDIMQFRGLGKVAVSELEALIERDQDE